MPATKAAYSAELTAVMERDGVSRAELVFQWASCTLPHCRIPLGLPSLRTSPILPTYI